MPDLVDLHDPSDHTMVVLFYEFLLQDVGRRRGRVFHFELVMVIDLTLSAEDIDEMLLLCLSALHNAQSLLVSSEVPDVRMHIEYGIILMPVIGSSLY